MFKRKLYLKMLMSLLLVALVAPPVHAQTLTVADGDYTQVLGPIYANSTNQSGFSYGPGYVEILYPKSLLTKAENDMTGCNITGITYYSNQFTFTGGTIEVQICETSNANLNSEISENPTTIATFSDVQNYYNSSTGMWTLDFGSNSFTYSGDENLLVRINVTAKGSREGDSRFYYKSTYEELGSTTTVIKTTYTIKSSGHGSTYNLPKTTFTYEPGTLAEYDAKVSPSSLNFGEIRVGSEETKNITLKNSGANAFTPTLTFPTGYSTTWTPVSIASGETVTIPVIFNPADAGEYNGTLIIDCTNGIVKEVSITGSATKSITVADGSSSNSNVPVYASWYDRNQHNQIIYPASMLTDLIGKRVNGVTFFPSSTVGFYGGNIAIRLTTSEAQSSFSSANYVTEIPETPFGSIVPASSSKTLAIPCDEGQEFLYTGGNLIVDILTTTYTSGEGNYSTSTSFKGISQTGGSLYAYSSTSGVNGSSFSPTVANFLPMVKFNYEDAEAGVYVTPAELSFGGEDFVCGNNNTDTKTFKVSNTTDAVVTPVLHDETGFFSINPTTPIEAGTNATIEVTYAPTAAGTHHTATVTVGDKTVTLTGTAVAPTIEGTVTPAELTFSCVKGKTATGTITVANTGNSAFAPEFSVAAPFSIEEATEIAVGASKDFTVTYSPTAVGNDMGTLTVNIGTQEPIIVALNGTAKEIGSELLVCDGEATSYVAPVYGYYYDTQDSKTQFIYPAEDLKDLVGRKITSVKFFPKTTIGINAGKLQLLMKETEQTNFSREGYSGPADDMIEDMKVVATIVYPLRNDTELMFEFDEPVLYKGGNLAFETYVLEKGSYAQKSFVYYGEKTDGYTACYANSSENGLEEFLPKAFFESDAAPATEIATLRELCGSTEGKYTIQEELLGVYMQDKSVWFKDENGSAIDFQTPGAEKVYWINDVSTKDFDQSNWIEVDFSNVDVPEDVAGNEPNVYIQNLTGIFTNENGNPKLVLTETPAAADVTPVTDPTKAYNPNPYIPASFEGTQNGYFFSKPKVQEYAYFVKAQWDGSKMVMTSDTEYNPEGFTGSFSIKPVDGFDETHVGKFYEFHGIVRMSGTVGSPRLQADGDGIVVEATDLDPKSGTTTAISTVGVNGEVKSVKYVNVAGVVSDRPFEGVNIVVTEYTDGSRTTVKMVR